MAGERAAGVRDERLPASPEDDRLGSRRLVHGRPAPVGGRGEVPSPCW